MCAECSKAGLGWLYQVHLLDQQSTYISLDASNDIFPTTTGQQMSCQLCCVQAESRIEAKFLPTSTLTIFPILVNQHIVLVTALKHLF